MNNNSVVIEHKYYMRKQFQWKKILRYLVMSIIAIIFLFPIYWVFISSVKSPSEIFAVPAVFWPKTWRWFHYAEVFQQVPFARWLLNSALVSSVVTIVALITHSMAAYSLARLKYPGRRLIFMIIISTLMIPFSAIMVPLFILIRWFGWINTYYALIIPAIPNAFGIFLLHQFYLGIPRELEEAATIDGCGPAGIFFRIIIPISKPILAALAVFFFLANWNNFLWPLVVTNSDSMKVIQVGIAGYSGQYQNPWAYIMAADTLAVIPTIILFIILQKHLMASITLSGVKR